MLDVINLLDVDSSVSASELAEKMLNTDDGNRYKFIRTIGFGTINSILLVEDTIMERQVAMSMVENIANVSNKELANFISEAKITAMLEHPNIVPIHDIGLTENSSPYYIMKYLKGKTLTMLLRSLRGVNNEKIKEFPLSRRLQIFVRVCNAISFAHSHGISHCHVCSDNINIGEFGDVVVYNWSMARPMDTPLETDSHSNRAFSTATSFGFFAPEQLRQKTNNDTIISSATDIYSLGCVLYSLLTLFEPFYNYSHAETSRLVAIGSIPKPTDVIDDEKKIPHALNLVVQKAMSLNPKDRYSNVEELKQEVLNFLSGHATKVEKASSLKLFELFVKRNKNNIIVTLTILIICIIALILLLLFI